MFSHAILCFGKPEHGITETTIVADSLVDNTVILTL